MKTLIQEIISWVRNTDKKLIIGISGHGAAGKTNFAFMLMDGLENDVNYLNTDAVIDYIHEGKLHRFKMTACHPSAHHIPSLERDVQMLKAGMDILTIYTHYLKSEILSSQNKLTIVEGMSVAFAKPELFDLLIYFYTNDDLELERRLNRDIEERGMDTNYLLQSHNERRIQYQVFMHPYSKNFDIIIKSTKGNIIIEDNTFGFNLNGSLGN